MTSTLGLPWRLVAWSRPAAARCLRATLAVPCLFAFSYLVVHNLQIATFATFGAFANLVMVGYAGRRAEVVTRHLALAVAASVSLSIGTAVNGSPAAASVVTLVLVFTVLFGSALGPNAASGAGVVLLAYVLAATTAGALPTLGPRLIGWWLASAVCTTLLIVGRRGVSSDKLRAALVGACLTVADALDAAVAGRPTSALRIASLQARDSLASTFAWAPHRPTGLSAADQALASMVESIEWLATVVADALNSEALLRRASDSELGLLGASARLLREVGAQLSGSDVSPNLSPLDRLLTANLAQVRTSVERDLHDALHRSFHVRVVALGTHATAAQALAASRRADVTVFAVLKATRPYLITLRRVMRNHASLRSIWLVNSLRGAMAFAAAIVIVNLTDVQHGFWVVVGVLAALQTRAAATAASALRAIGGTVGGLAVGWVLIAAVGTSRSLFWTILPLSVLVAAYAPGTTPVAVGQAAFTVMVTVINNLVVPVGWAVGLVRVEDVAIGCGVSLLLGILWWPRGASRILADDLADAFVRGGEYLDNAARWALGLSEAAPSQHGAAVDAGFRVDEALRGFVAEQGARAVGDQDVWRVVGAARRLRLDARSLASLRDESDEPATAPIADFGDRIAAWYGTLGDLLGGAEKTGADLDAHSSPLEALPAGLSRDVRARRPTHIWVALHLEHLRQHLPEVMTSSQGILELRRRAWWR